MAAIPGSMIPGPLADAESGPIPGPAAGFTDTDRFFEARGRFRIFRTCNTWISRILRAAGLRFGIWTPTRYAVTLSVA